MSATTKPVLRRSTDPPGYWLKDVFRIGFNDDPSLSDVFRRRIAIWAQSSGVASDVQRELLAVPSDQTMSAAGRRATKLAGVEGSPMWGLLSDDEQCLVEEPGKNLQLHGVTYPLSIGQLATLTGATNDQLRNWHELGLIKARRSSGGHRQFFADAAMRAFVLHRQMSQSYVTVLRDIQRFKGSSFLVGLATVLREHTSEFDPAEQDLIIQTASSLQQLSIAFAKKSDTFSS